MSMLLQLLTSGLALGAVYALTALGFVVIYRASKVFNFAQGELLSLGAFLMIALASSGLGWGVSLLLAMLLTGLTGVIVERILLRPLVGRPVFVTIIVTIFVSLILRSVILVVWGPSPFGMPTPWETTATIQVGPSRVLVNSGAAMVAAAVALASFFVLVRKSRVGVAMRAASADQETAMALGIPVGRILGICWFIAGAYAALAGVFLGMFPNSVDANLGFVALRAFPAVIVGGLDSAGGTVVAALALGVIEVLTQGYVNPHLGHFGQNLHSVLPYLVMIAFLVVRPYGLLGKRDVERL